MVISKNNVRLHLPFIIFFFILLVVGFSIYKDYGISWDEPVSRDNNGVLNYDFIRTGNYIPIINGNEKYHGPAFEIILVGIEHICGLKDMRDIYFMRHLVTFLVFAISVVFFYLLCLRYLKSKWLALTGCVFLVLSPRIFADAFYNSKDLTFMSFVIINLYTTLRFLESKNLKTTIYHAIITAFVIDIRILGIVIPCFTWLILFIEFIKSPGRRKIIIITTTVYSLLLFAAIILFWPVLWHRPVDRFILAMKEMSKYPWNGMVLYSGKNIDASLLPWHYIPVWILISTPILYSILFIPGIFSIFRKIILRNNISTFELLNIYIFFLPLFAIIFLHSVVYDGWRHMYFVYPSLLLISLIGLEKGFAILNKNKFLAFSAIAGISIYILFIGCQMVRLHPYENVYFNFIAGKSLNDIKQKYELDYWALSYKEGIDYILKSDSTVNITIDAAETLPAKFNLQVLPENERCRISLSAEETELSDYYLSAYRFHHSDYNYKAAYNVIRDNGTLLSVFDLRNKRHSVIDDSRYRIAHFIKTNEDSAYHWSRGNIIFDSYAYSGNNVEFIDSNTMYAAGFSINPPSKFIADTTAKNYLTVNFQIKTKSSYDMIVVLEIDTAGSTTFDWQSKFLQSSISNKWAKRSMRFKLPKMHSSNDLIKVYIWNEKLNNFYVDDMEINFYSVSENDFKKLILPQMDFKIIH